MDAMYCIDCKWFLYIKDEEDIISYKLWDAVSHEVLEHGTIMKYMLLGIPIQNVLLSARFFLVNKYKLPHTPIVEVPK